MGPSSDPSGAGDVTYPPKHDADFAAYAAAVAARYGRQASLSGAAPWTRTQSVKRSRDLERALRLLVLEASARSCRLCGSRARPTAPAIHAVDPRMRVLMSGDLMSSDSTRPAGAPEEPWIQRLLSVDPPGRKARERSRCPPVPGTA